MKNRIISALVLSTVLAAPAFAVGPDFSTLTAAVDLSTVGTAILAIAAIMALPRVIRAGSRMVLGFIK